MASDHASRSPLGISRPRGLAYVVIVTRRMRVQTTYKPEFEDWLFHALLPLAAYAILAFSAFAASSHTREALFGAGAATLLRLFVGIHTALGMPSPTKYLLLVTSRSKG